MSASRYTRGRLNMQPSGLNIYAARSCAENARFCRRQVGLGSDVFSETPLFMLRDVDHRQ
jgi:hypothetical protein